MRRNKSLLLVFSRCASSSYSRASAGLTENPNTAVFRAIAPSWFNSVKPYHTPLWQGELRTQHSKLRHSPSIPLQPHPLIHNSTFLIHIFQLRTQNSTLRTSLAASTLYPHTSTPLDLQPPASSPTYKPSFFAQLRPCTRSLPSLGTLATREHFET